MESSFSTHSRSRIRTAALCGTILSTPALEGIDYTPITSGLASQLFDEVRLVEEEGDYALSLFPIAFLINRRISKGRTTPS